MAAPRKARTVAGVAAAIFLQAASAAGYQSAPDPLSPRWPAVEYQAKPVEYVQNVIGDKPWSKQEDVLRALVPRNARVSVRSGHKIGKSKIAAWAALWFFGSYPDARVFITAPTDRQINKIVWREVRITHKRSRVRLEGEPQELARTGLRAPDLREIVGFTSRDAEGAAGTSGANMLFIFDEASGISQAVFDAMEGNRAGGARALLLGNPTRNEGEHYESFESKSEFYTGFTISSEDTPNVQTGETVVPGLAERWYVEEKKREWGEESALYMIRVKGLHAKNDTGKIISVALIDEAEDRWDDPETPQGGRLFIGIDPAGPGSGGDRSTFGYRRGQKIFELYEHRGLTESAHLAHLLGLIKEKRKPNEAAPIVVIDREGPIGSKIFYLLRDFAERHPDAFEVHGVRASDPAYREPHLYDRTRDELWANLAQWLRAGGAIPRSVHLARELHAPAWHGDVKAKLKATSKDELRKKENLGRSPDLADVVALLAWTPLSVADAERNLPGREAVVTEDSSYEPEEYEDTAAKMDPYGGQYRS